MSRVLRSVRKRKKGYTLGALAGHCAPGHRAPVDVIDREGYAELEVDAKVEWIRSLVPLGCPGRDVLLVEVVDVGRRKVPVRRQWAWSEHHRRGVVRYRSNRTPRLNVSWSTVHVSCAYKPSSDCRTFSGCDVVNNSSPPVSFSLGTPKDSMTSVQAGISDSGRAD